MSEEQITRARKALERARKALDDIYNHNEAARAAVVLHYGVSHTELDSAIASLATAARAAPTPLTDERLLEVFAKVDARSEQDAALIRMNDEGGHVDTVEWLGARHGWRAFLRAARAVEAAHGIASPGQGLPGDDKKEDA